MAAVSEFLAAVFITLSMLDARVNSDAGRLPTTYTHCMILVLLCLAATLIQFHHSNLYF